MVVALQGIRVSLPDTDVDVFGHGRAFPIILLILQGHTNCGTVLIHKAVPVSTYLIKLFPSFQALNGKPSLADTSIIGQF